MKPCGSLQSHFDESFRPLHYLCVEKYDSNIYSIIFTFIFCLEFLSYADCYANVEREAHGQACERQCGDSHTLQASATQILYALPIKNNQKIADATEPQC